MSKRKKVGKWIIYGLFVALIALQAVAGLLSGNIFYVNYKNQPLNSFGALIVDGPDSAFTMARKMHIEHVAQWYSGFRMDE
jgi:hypothetical protein